MSGRGSAILSAEAAVLSGVFLAGALMNIAILDVPVLLEVKAQTSDIVDHWCRIYEYGSRLYPFLSIAICLLYGFALLGGGKPQRYWGTFLGAATITLAMVPYTWIFMMPTNNKLFQAQALHRSGVMTSSEEIQALILTWQKLHFVRSLFPLVGALLGSTRAF
ncbi:hypothetical protein F4802DRAFT_572999 [Xylaria palmicola]|nr:hypothetical protein F4802DRAFT_572999 [Xylaria palmicola]